VKEKKIRLNAINLNYSVYVYESVNLDDGDSAISGISISFLSAFSKCCKQKNG